MQKHTFFDSTFASLFCLVLFIASGCKSADPVLPDNTSEEKEVTFPAALWQTIKNAEDFGFSSSGLDLVGERYEQYSSAALLVVVGGKILYQKGNINYKYQSHSLRKSFLSALYGSYVKDGSIDLGLTMEELSIDDDEGLSSEEKQATIRDLLKARSGVYHPAHYESEGMTNNKPDRYSHSPSTFWYYNNWDFNVLGTIFMQQTGKDIFEEMEAKFAIPLQMDFKASDGWYATTGGIHSRHKAYPFRISANDLARFGLLMLRKGKWKDQQIVPESWVAESTQYYSDASASGTSGYGYMWWVNKLGTQYPLLPNLNLPEGAYMASGVGGQIVLVIPQYDMVIVHRVNTDVGNSVSNANIGRLFQLILNARL